jgi:hypothetical protein
VAGVDYSQDAKAGDPTAIGAPVLSNNTFKWCVDNSRLWISVGSITNGNTAWFIGRRITARAAHHAFRARICLSKHLTDINGGSLVLAVGKETSSRPDFSASHVAGWNTSSNSMKPQLNASVFAGVNTSSQFIAQDFEFEINISGTTARLGLRSGGLNIQGAETVTGTGYASGDPIYVGFYFTPGQIGGFDYLREKSDPSTTIPFR